MSEISNTSVVELFPSTDENLIQKPSLGQIWRDTNHGRTHRRLLIMAVTPTAVTYQDLNTGELRAVRRQQFNRGDRGFTYCGEFSQLDQTQAFELLKHLGVRYWSHLLRCAGMQKTYSKVSVTIQEN